MTDKLLYRILSGKTVVKVKNEIYVIKPLSVEYKYLIEEYYEELLSEYGQFNTLFSKNSLLNWMIKLGMWSEDEDKKLLKYKSDIDELKVRLFECGFRTNEKKVVREALKVARNNLELLNNKKHAFDFLTVEGSASIAKNKYLLGLSLYQNNKRIFTPKKFFKSKFPYLDNIIIEYNKQFISSEVIRGIARSDTWRKYWCLKESDDIFGKKAIELSDEQLNLISWTRLYDNIYQHPDCPDDSVIDDDDALDGFLILDKRKRDIDKGHQIVDNLVTNEKIRSADEMFIVVQDREDAKKIQNLNDASTRAQIRNREKTIEKHGMINETDLPDVKLKKQLAINNKAAQLIKGK